MLMKNVLKTLTAVTILSLSVSLCGCLKTEKEHSTRETLESQVMEYVQEKYGFKPKIDDWQEKQGLYNKWSHEVLVNDGTDQFIIKIDPNDNITDNYEIDAINEDLQKWADSILPGVVYASSDYCFFAKDQKYNGDVWNFLKENRNSPEVKDLKFIYVNQPLDSQEATDFTNELGKFDFSYCCCIVSCPSMEAAEFIQNKAVSYKYADLVGYAPYVDESISYNSYYKTLSHYRYDGRQAGNFLYLEGGNNGSDPIPEEDYYIEQADGSMSDIYSTYVIHNNHPVSDGGKRKLNVVIIMPLSDIGENVVLSDSTVPDVQVVNGLKCVYASSPDGELSDTTVFVYGEYAVINMYFEPGTTYFSIK